MLSRIHPAWWLFGGSGLVLLGLIAILVVPGMFEDRPAAPIVVHCAAALRRPMEDIAAEYLREHGRKVELRFAASQSILSSARFSDQGDLFLPADESYIQDAKTQGLIAEVMPLARMKAVLAVHADNPKKTRTWNDLLAQGVTLAQAEPDVAAIGRLTKQTLLKQNRWERLAGHTTVYKGTVTDVANAVSLRAVDAGIVWDVIARPMPGLSLVEMPELEGIEADVQLAVLKRSAQPTEALRLARYIAASDRGLARFRDHGFTQVRTGDPAVLKPKLVLYAGAMLRPAIEETVKEFEAREGVEIQRDYNGCGLLVSQMNSGHHPDAFVACDTRFMADVQKYFEAPMSLSNNQLVIAVAQGNPHGIKTLRDLAKPGIKVGVGHEHQCALGAITRDTFIQSGVYKDVKNNVVVQTPTGDLLINQLRAKSLDAVVAYRSNALPFDDIEFTAVTGIPCAVPSQPMAVGKETRFPHLTRRLFEALKSPESRRRFEALGFGWEAQEKK